MNIDTHNALYELSYNKENKKDKTSHEIEYEKS